jgi:hypothetical protein
MHESLSSTGQLTGQPPRSMRLGSRVLVWVSSMRCEYSEARYLDMVRGHIDIAGDKLKHGG